jgi:hypothetical protein
MDFGEPSRRMFYNVLGMEDEVGRRLPLINSGWRLSPGQQYRLHIYHFYPEEGPLKNDRPIYWLGCRPFGAAISLLGSTALRADSEYDSKVLTIQVAGDVRTTQNALTLFRTMNPTDDNAATVDITFDVEVPPDRLRNVLQAMLIGVLVAVPAAIAGYPVPAWKAALIAAGGLLAGFATVFRFNRSI